MITTLLGDMKKYLIYSYSCLFYLSNWNCFQDVCMSMNLAVDTTLMACVVPQKCIENTAVDSSAAKATSPSRGPSEFRLEWNAES